MNQQENDFENKNNGEMNLQEQENRRKWPGIGLRNIKTAVSATLCAILYAFFDKNPTFACIGAVFGMDNTLPTSLKTGGNRLVGTIIGGFLGMALFSVSHIMIFPKVSLMFLLFAGVILLIYISQLLQFSGAIQAGAVVFFIIMLNTPEDEYISYALNRIFDTAVGVTMSIFINWIHLKAPGKSN